MHEIELNLWNQGYKYIACIDEVGRGCLAGDVVACAIIMPREVYIEGINDSKKLTPKKREKLYDEILEKAIAVGIGSVDPKTIDEINIKKSTLLAMVKAIEDLKDKDGQKVFPDYILIDAEHININIPQQSIIKGDEKCHGIAAASIIAKVHRDRKCFDMEKSFPGYGFEKHKGYGTKQHREALKSLGACEIHRRSFLKKILGD